MKSNKKNFNSKDHLEDYYEVMREIQNDPKVSQRKLANKLGLSLGKINYCLKALKMKGLVKIENFKKNPNKINYFYILTPKGLSEKTKITLNFMKIKMREYDQLKSDLEKEKKNVGDN